MASPFNHTVLKANIKTRVVSRYAGIGSDGNKGDGGLATNAELGNPWDVKMKNNGDVYILDEGYGNIRVVNSSGMINLFTYNSTFLRAARN